MLDVMIPANTSATVYLPAARADSVTEGGKEIGTVGDVKIVKSAKGMTILSVGSGVFHFECGLDGAKT